MYIQRPNTSSCSFHLSILTLPSGTTWNNSALHMLVKCPSTWNISHSLEQPVCVIWVPNPSWSPSPSPLDSFIPLQVFLLQLLLPRMPCSFSSHSALLVTSMLPQVKQPDKSIFLNLPNRCAIHPRGTQLSFSPSPTPLCKLVLSYKGVPSTSSSVLLQMR